MIAVLLLAFALGCGCSKTQVTKVPDLSKASQPPDPPQK
jgi:hypothetical protein